MVVKQHQFLDVILENKAKWEGPCTFGRMDSAYVCAISGSSASWNFCGVRH